ncbi:hypothetical protein MTR67_017346 [Solanum verrucosum]|uniref:Dihydroneopterin aldolase n=1 Tax=Solanum verrucosum TaxID=315347 RepID=A0AAF0TLE5_SOLVR|nr:hypothetical protein MTR67_017346 [Solanum verrucosum]
MGCSLRGSMTGPMDIPKGDKLVLRGLKFHGYHGVNPEDRSSWWMSMLEWIFNQLNPQHVFAVSVQVGKPHVAVQGPVDYLGVEIIRHCRDLDV